MCGEADGKRQVEKGPLMELVVVEEALAGKLELGERVLVWVKRLVWEVGYVLMGYLPPSGSKEAPR